MKPRLQTLIAGFIVEIQNNDVFIYLGERYVLDGESFNWINGLGSWNPGTVIDLQKEIIGK